MILARRPAHRDIAAAGCWLSLLLPCMRANGLVQSQPPSRWIAGGIDLSVAGVPALSGGLVQLFAADGAGLYSSGGAPPAIALTALAGGGTQVVATYSGPHGFRASETVTAAGNRVTWNLDARQDGAAPIRMEWNAARIPAAVVAGADYRARAVGGATVAGAAGYLPARGDMLAASLGGYITDLDIVHTGVGSLHFTAPARQSFLLFDARRDSWLADKPVYWLGVPSVMLLPGRPVHLQIVLVISPPAAAQAGPDLSVAAPAEPMARAKVPAPALLDAEGDPILIPEPKEVRFTSDRLALSGTVPVWLAKSIPKGSRLAAAVRRLTERWQRRYGIRMPIRFGPWSGAGIAVTVAGAGEPERMPASPANAQGYALRVTEHGAAITGRDEAGAWYGLQTLRQLVEGSPHRESWVHGAQITDWPSMAFRGAHLFVGKHALPFHSRLISRIFARFKMNALVLECEYSRWKSHPEIRVPEAMPLRDLRAEVRFARRRFLQPIPLIPSLSHTDWMFKNGRHLNLAEDPGNPHAYNVSDPRSYRIVFDIYREAIGIFHPSVFHIGHDELLSAGSSTLGTYPLRGGNRRVGAAALFSQDVWRVTTFLRAQNIRPMMWADMLLAPTNGNPARYPVFPAANAPDAAAAQQMRQSLPGDMILDDWRYEPGSEQRNGLNLFLDSGHDAIGCSWFQPQNIRGWALQCVRKGATGVLQTTWAGYNSRESLLHTELRQFDAFVLAAEYGWSGTQKQPGDGSAPSAADSLPWDAREAFIRSWSRSSQSSADGWRVNLIGAANIRLKAPDSPGLPWCSPNTAQAAWRITDPLNGVEMLSETDPEGVRLGSTLEANRGEAGPAALVVHPNALAGHIALLQACAFPSSDGTTVATVTLTYSDGSHTDLPLRYGRETGALNDAREPNGMNTALIPWRAGEAAPRLWLRICTLTNPQPRKRIAAIRIASSDPAATPIVLGITGW